MAIKGNFRMGVHKNPLLVTIEIEFVSPPDPGTSLIPCVLAEGKDFGIACVKDDAGLEDWNGWYPVLAGGIEDSFGDVWPGLFYDDGCGNQKHWQVSQAINANPLHDPDSGAVDVAKWPEIQVMYESGIIYPTNHGYDHGGGERPYDVLYQILLNRKVIWEKFGLAMGTTTIPGTEEGYTQTGKSNFSKMICCQGFPFNTADGNNAIIQGFDTMVPQAWETTLALLTRIYTGTFTTTDDMDYLKGRFDELVVGPLYRILHWFSHGINNSGSYTNYNNAMHYMANHAEFGRVGVWNLQQIWDYESVKRSIDKSEKIVGNKLIVNISFANNIERHLFYLNSSFIATGAGVDIKANGIKMTTVMDMEKTSSEENGLVNLYGFNPRIMSPFNDPLPPQITSCVRSATNKLIMTYDRAVTQSLVGAYLLIDDEDAEIAVTDLDGSGTEWELTSATDFPAGSKMVYRCQDGDAVDNASINKIVPSYIKYPISED